jgi:hypothetical protein
MKEFNREMFNRDLGSWLIGQQTLLENALTLLNTMKLIEDENFLNDNQFNDLYKVVIEYLRLVGVMKEYPDDLEVLIDFLVP